MDSEEISKIVEAEISSYAFEEPDPDTTYGKPWTEEKILSYIPKLKKALVKPYLKRFRLSKSKEHFESEVYADYWVIAIDNGYIQWFDPESDEYGLGAETESGEFVSIGVRGIWLVFIAQCKTAIKAFKSPLRGWDATQLCCSAPLNIWRYV